MEKNKKPSVLHYNIIKGIKPAMRYKDGENFKDWQTRARERLIELIGLNKIEKPEDDCFNLEYKKDMGEYTDYSFSFKSEDGYFVPCHLWVPNGKEGKIPVVICVPGHSTGASVTRGEIIHDKDYVSVYYRESAHAPQVVQSGYCALTIEPRGMGECGGSDKGVPECEWPSYTALMIGRTLLGEKVYDSMRAIDIITKHFDEVDTDKIAIMGGSGGGTVSIYTAAIDPRIKMAMPSASLCTFLDSIVGMQHCICNYVPNIAFDFDMGDLCGMIAPRGLLVVSGEKDPIFPDCGTKVSFELAKRYYKIAGAKDKCAWVKGDQGHRFYKDLAWPIFNKMFNNI